MARPKNPYKKIEIKLCISPFVVDQVRYISKQNSISSSEIFAQMIERGMKHYYNDIGLTPLKIKILRNYTEKRILYGIDTPPSM
jgi:hypothetical protein